MMAWMTFWLLGISISCGILEAFESIFQSLVAMLTSSYIGIAVKRDSSGAGSIQQVAVSVYSGTRYSDSEK